MPYTCMPHICRTLVCRTFACCTPAGRLHVACASGMALIACRMHSTRACMHAARTRMPNVLACRACLRAARVFMLPVPACRVSVCRTLVSHAPARRTCACCTQARRI
eukprot:6175595-Pleurochrysis_carterae.AAC.1